MDESDDAECRKRRACERRLCSSRHILIGLWRGVMSGSERVEWLMQLRSSDEYLMLGMVEMSSLSEPHSLDRLRSPTLLYQSLISNSNRQTWCVFAHAVAEPAFNK